MVPPFASPSPQQLIKTLQWCLCSIYKSLTLKIQSSVLNIRNIMLHLQNLYEINIPKTEGHTSYKYSFELRFQWNSCHFLQLSDSKLNRTTPRQKQGRFFFWIQCLFLGVLEPNLQLQWLFMQTIMTFEYIIVWLYRCSLYLPKTIL